MHYWFNKGHLLKISEEEGFTALFIACSERCTKIAGYLIDNGADINKADHKGRTPLQFACVINFKSAVELLVSKGANIDQNDHEGWTPLMSACLQENSEIIPILTNNGANVNKVNKDGYTPLRFACDCKHIENVTALLNAKADVMKVDKCGNSPLHAVCNIQIAGEMDFLNKIESLFPLHKMSMFLSFGIEYCKFVEECKTHLDQDIDLYNNKACLVVSLLLTKRPDLNRINEQGNTALPKQKNK